MTLSDIDTKVSELTKTDTTSYPTANRLINYNIWNQNIVTWILQSQDASDFQDWNYSGYSTLSVPLAADQRDYKFGITDNVVEIKRVDVTYDNVTSNRAFPIDRERFDIGLIEDYTTIDSYFTQTAPVYDFKNWALWLFPKPTATTGTIEVEVSRTAKDITSSEYTTGTITPGFDVNFHHVPAFGMAFEYFISEGMQTDATRMENELNKYKALIQKQYGSKQKDTVLFADSIYQDNDFS